MPFLNCVIFGFNVGLNVWLKKNKQKKKTCTIVDTGAFKKM